MQPENDQNAEKKPGDDDEYNPQSPMAYKQESQKLTFFQPS